MVELIVGTYGVLCWLLFKKFKVIPVTTYTVCTAILGGIVILGLLFICLSVFHPVSHDGRMYAPVVQITPQVRGIVVEVPIEANRPMKRGDVLFRIDPSPYQFEVDRLKASLEVKNRDYLDRIDKLRAAEAATKEARAKLSVSESVNDQQLVEAFARASSQAELTQERLGLAKIQLGRAKELMAKGVGSQGDLDRAETQVKGLEQELSKAQSDKNIAAEQLKTGKASLTADAQNLARLEAEERRAQTAVNTLMETNDPKLQVTPEQREVMALLDKARFDLDQTTVRAPTDGYVPQNLLRPGMMAVPIPLKPLMMYVVGERPSLVASFQQKTIANIKPGMEGEAVFKLYPGRSFKVKVRRVLSAIREGEIDAGGQLVTATPEHAPGYVPVVFDYEDDVASLNLPIGAQASVAVYTDKVHVLSIVRKIILRMKSWENYVF